MLLLSWVSFCILMVCPGSWFSFSRLLDEYGFGARLLLAAALSPTLILIEFYAFRLAGVPFGVVAWLLVLVNAPAVWLILRRAIPQAPKITRESAAVVGGWAAALAFPIFYLVNWLHDPAIRANWDHAWLHTDVVYLISNGQLRPEDPQLAGVALAYPWAGHIVQAVSSYVLGLPPNLSYIWTNLVWLACAFGAVGAITWELGGKSLAPKLSVIWLAFGVNSVGYWGRRLAPGWMARRRTLWGDPRFTPWLRKFGVFEQTCIGIGLFAVLLFFLFRPPGQHRLRSLILPVLLLLASLMIFYPILFLAGAMAIFVRILVTGLYPKESESRPWGEIGVLTLAVSAVGSLGLVYLGFVTTGRATGATFGLSAVMKVIGKAVGSFVVLLPFWIAVVAMWWQARKKTPQSTYFLVGSGLGCVVLFSLLDIPNVTNEYKYIFVAAFCLVPYAALISARAVQKCGRIGLPLMLVGTLLLASPVIRGRYTSGMPEFPKLETGAFELALSPTEGVASLTDSIRRTTPANSILVTRETAMNLVTLTGRATYVPYTTKDIQGYAMSADYLLKDVRGYKAEEVDARRETVRQLYEGSSDARASAVRRIQALARPLVLVVNKDSDAELIRWVRNQPGAEEVSAPGSIEAWLLKS